MRRDRRRAWLPARLITLGIDAHQGTLFGPLNQLALIAFAVGLPLLDAGYRMWCLRRPPGSLVGRPPARGAWQRLPRAPVVAGAAAALAVEPQRWDGRFFPLATRDEVRAYCRHHAIPAERAEAAPVPLWLTKRGVLVRATRS